MLKPEMGIKESDIRDASALMTEDKFWELIGESRVPSKLCKSLSLLPEDELFGFQYWWNHFMNLSYRQDLWAAAYIYFGGCSDDSFNLFRSLLISLGRKTFYNAISDADTLCDVFAELPEGNSNDEGGEETEFFVMDILNGRHDDDEYFYNAAKKYKNLEEELPEIEFEWEEDDEESLRKVCPKIFERWWGHDYTGSKTDTKISLPTKDEVKQTFTKENLVGVGDFFEGYRFEKKTGTAVKWQFLIKRLKPQYLSNYACRAVFKKEFDVLTRLELWSIPACYQLVDDPDEVYLVMPMREGIPVYVFLQSEQGRGFFRDHMNAADYYAGILRTFAYLHRNGVVYNDLIPGKAYISNQRGYFRMYDFERCWIDKDPHLSKLSLSAPGEPGISRTPTPGADLQSLGLLIEYIGSEVKGFHKWRFSGLRKKCMDPNQTAETLLKKVLKIKKEPPLSFILPWIIGFAVTYLLTHFLNKLIE